LGTNFPFFGKSKLQLAKEIISTPIITEGQENLIDNIHYTCLVMFSRSAEVAVPWNINTEEQRKKISDRLEKVSHTAGSGVYIAIKFCEDIISEFINHPKRKQKAWKVILHVFSDGEDNASDLLRVRELSEQNSISGSDKLHHRFLYSFNNSFEQVKNLGESLKATVIMVKTDNIKLTLNERNKLVFQFLSTKTIVSGFKSGFNLIKNETPEITLLYKQILKLDQVFVGDILLTEGIFRESASVSKARTFAEKLALSDDCLTDYDDPIKIAHATKSYLMACTLIPSDLQAKLLQKSPLISSYKSIFNDSKLFPEKNCDILKILLNILNRLITAQKQLPHNKALTLEGISRIFGPILFNAVNQPPAAVVNMGGNFDPSMLLEMQANISSCVAFMIENVSDIF